MTNLELDMRLIQPQDVLDYYQGPNAWGLPPSSGTSAERRSPGPTSGTRSCPGAMRHFGLALTPDAPPPCGVTAHWTQHVKVVEIPVPWQTWRARLREPGHRRDPQQPRFRGAGRRSAASSSTLATRIPLDQLNWDLTTPLPWQPVPGDPVAILPGPTVELPIPVPPGTQAVLVRYEVALARNPANVLTRFVNEAELSTICPRPRSSGA